LRTADLLRTADGGLLAGFGPGPRSDLRCAGPVRESTRNAR